MSPAQHGKSVKMVSEIKPPVQKRQKLRFVVIWEFQVRGEMQKNFEKVYGPQGDWAQLFKQDEAYIGTELVRKYKNKRTYLTLDFWTSQKAYDAFRLRNRASYRAVDRKCERMTESEREIGRFAQVSSK